MALRRPAMLFAALLVFSTLSVCGGVYQIPVIFSAVCIVVGIVMTCGNHHRAGALMIICAVLSAYAPIYEAASSYADMKTYSENAGFGKYTATVEDMSVYGDKAAVFVKISSGGLDGTRAVLAMDITKPLPEVYDKISFKGHLLLVGHTALQELSLYGDKEYYYSRGCRMTFDVTSFETLGRLPEDERGLREKYYFYISDRLHSDMKTVGSTDTFSYTLALLTGDRTKLPDSVGDKYVGAGLMPFLCISGLHVVIATEILKYMLAAFRLPRTARNIVAFMFLFFIIVVTGGRGSVLRAAVMSGVLMISDIIGRNSDKLSSVATAFMIVSFANPYCIFDYGTRLSFLSMLGIICAVQLSDRFVIAGRELAAGIKNTLFSSFFAVGFSSIPVISGFGGMYLLSPFSNLFGAVIFTPLMYLLVLLAFFAFLPDVARNFLAYPAAYLIKIFEFTADIFSGIPFSYAEIQLPAEVELIYMVFLLAFVFSSAFMKREKIMIFGFAVAAVPYAAILAAHVLNIVLN